MAWILEGRDLFTNDVLQNVLDLVLHVTGTKSRPALEVRASGNLALYDPNRRKVVVNGIALWELCKRFVSIHAPAILAGFIAHEMGHHLLILQGRVFRDGVLIELGEMTSDYTAGAALALAGYGRSEVSTFVGALKSVNFPQGDGEHGTNLQREQDVWSGYDVGVALRSRVNPIA